MSLHRSRIITIAVAALLAVFVASPVAAHGVTVTADVGDGVVAELTFTDETGDVCYSFSVGGDVPVTAHIHRVADGQEIAELAIDAIVAAGDEVCVRLAVDVVVEILADVDAFGLDVHGPGFDDGDIAILRKPRPPGFDVEPVASANSDRSWTSNSIVRSVAMLAGAACAGPVVAVLITRMRKRRSLKPGTD